MRAMPQIHEFDDSGWAYDESQCNESIKDGDILVSPEDIAILFQAWPVSIHDYVPHESKFHGWKRPGDWLNWDENPEAEAYLQSYLIAKEIK
jgi:hypothetical protein